jgi:hypothetical protein
MNDAITALMRPLALIGLVAGGAAAAAGEPAGLPDRAAAAAAVCAG